MVWLRHFGILDHSILPALIALRFGLASHNRRKAVFGLTPNVYLNWRRNFLAIGCFTETFLTDYISLLLVNISVVDTMAISIVALYWCWSSHFSANLNFFMLSRHLRSYKSQLLNYWSTTIIGICCLSISGCYNPLIMTHFCSN